MRITVNVTQEDINNGKKASCSACPIALAVNRENPNMSVQVRTLVALYMDRKGFILQRAMLPKSVTEFINKFDSCDRWQGKGKYSVEPFSFELEFK